MNTRYITVDDFKEFSGIDLEQRIKKDDNPSNTAQAFLDRVAYRLHTYIDANFYRRIDEEYPQFTDYQKEHHKRALLEQCLYVFKNGDISVDSGYDYERGEVAGQGAIVEKSIAPNAKQELMLCGLWCRKFKSRGRGVLGVYWLH